MGEHLPADSELLQHPLLAALKPEEFARIRRGIRSVSLEAEQHLFQHGEPARCFYIVISGQIKLYRLSPSGNEKIIDLIEPGHSFAEAVMFMDRRNYPVNASALAPTTLAAVEMQPFIDMLRDSVDVCFRLLGQLSMRLRHRLNEIDALALQNSTLRVVNYLLRQIPEEQAGPVTIELAAPKKTIAARLSIQPETLSRVFHNLEHAGIIEVTGSVIAVADAGRLQELVYAD